MILTPEEMLNAGKNRNSNVQTYFRDGIQLEKGATLSEKRIDKKIKLYQQYMDYFNAYPDRFLDLIKPINSKFEFKFFQRIFLRACVRYGRVLTIAPRAAGKSFICILASILICIFRSKSREFLCAPGKSQSAKISTQKLQQLFSIWPLLKEEIIGNGNYGADYVQLKFKNGSEFTIITPLGSSRGNRANCGVIEEFRFCYRFYFKNSPLFR